MFGKIYNIAVAVVAVTLVLLVIGGALFAVVQGLASYFGGVDLWGPVEAVLLPLLSTLMDEATALWTLLSEQAEVLWREAPSDPDATQEPVPPGEAGSD